MSYNRSSQRSTERGFSIVEFLISAALASIALLAVAQFFAMQARQGLGHSYRVEVQQALRASLDTMTRDIRLAGACIPLNGDFVAIDGLDGGGLVPDSITVRAGIVRNDMSCIRTSLSVLAAIGQSSFTVTSGTGFTPGMLVYLRNPGGTGEFTFVSSASATNVTVTTPATIDYPVGSGVFAIDERTYVLDTSGAVPRLNQVVNRATPEAFAIGLPDLQFQYQLAQNCPPCDVVDLPADDAAWRLVNEVRVTARAQSVGAARTEDQIFLTQTSLAKPRNLIP